MKLGRSLSMVSSLYPHRRPIPPEGTLDEQEPSGTDLGLRAASRPPLAEGADETPHSLGMSCGMDGFRGMSRGMDCSFGVDRGTEAPSKI